MRTLVAGVATAATVALVASLVASLEIYVLGAALVDALVLAILLGIAVRAVVPLAPSINAGVDFAAKELLELAVLLLGASVDLAALLRAGPALAAGIVLLVALGLLISYAIGRALKLPHSLAILVACGNAICGNSAIAAVAPVIGAPREHVASAIGFTAILGVAVVVGLPLLIGPFGLSDFQYGVLAGLTIYSVPQVLAAAFPVSLVSGQIATLVKLVRVLMLGPVVIFFTLTNRAGRSIATTDAPRVSLAGLVPWFIIGFLALAALRSAGWIPLVLADQLKLASHALTLVAMAALGLGVDLRSIRDAGRAVVLTVIASLGALILLSLALIHGLGIA